MVIDIIFLAVAAYGFFLGFTRGIIRTILTIMSFFIGLLAAFKFSPAATNMLENNFGEQPLMFVLGFILVFGLTMLLIRLLVRGIEGILHTMHINFFNQIAGGVLLTAVMVLLYSVLVWFGSESRIIGAQTKAESVTYPYLKDYPALVWRLGESLQPVVADFWEYTVDFLDRAQEISVERTEGKPKISDKPEDPDDVYPLE